MEQVGVGIDQNGFVAPLEKMAGAFLPPIDPESVAEAEVLHDAGQRHVADLNGQMDMVGHQTKSQQAMVVPLDAFLEKKKKPATVIIVPEDVLSGIASYYHVVQGAGKMDARFSWYGTMLAQRINLAILQA